jgi:hypothetical protein
LWLLTAGCGALESDSAVLSVAELSECARTQRLVRIQPF